MKKLGKKFLLFAICMIFVFLLTDTKAYASNTAGKSLTYDPLTNCFYFESKDTTATSATRYQTIGFYITRCQLGQQAEYGNGSQYIKIDLAGETGSITQVIGGQQVTRWIISRDDIIAKINASGNTDWANEVHMATSGLMSQPYYLKFDAIMVTKKPLGGNYVLSGTLLSDHWTEEGNPAYSFVDSNPSKQRCYNKYEVDDLKNAYGWADPSSIDNHFNLYYEITGITPPIIEPEGDGNDTSREEFVIRVGKAVPDFVTYNESSDGLFHIGEAIPTTEHIDNFAEADQWYGTADIGLKTVRRTAVFPYRYTKTIEVRNASGVVISSYTIPVSGSITLNDEVSYYYIQNVNIYDLQSVSVSNGAFPSTANYNSTGNVNVVCYINGAYNPSSYSSQPDEAYHVIKPTIDTTLITASTQDQCIEVARQRMMNAKMQAKNDYLSINGSVVLDDNALNLSNLYHRHTTSCYEQVQCGSTNYTKTLNTSAGDPSVCVCGGHIEYVNTEASYWKCHGYWNNWGVEGYLNTHYWQEQCGSCNNWVAEYVEVCEWCWQKRGWRMGGCTCPLTLHGVPNGSSSWGCDPHTHGAEAYICDTCGHDYGSSLPYRYDYTCTTCGTVYENEPDHTRGACTYVRPNTAVLICGIAEGWHTHNNSYAYNEVDLTNPAVLPTEYYSSTDMEIPARKANGEYHTSITANYVNVMNGANTSHTRNQTSNNHIKEGYWHNEPIFVHTPIICPFHIEGAETETQLINETTGVYQLLLDGRYTFRFDSAVHSSNFGYENLGDDVDRYDRYIEEKAVRFPFSILYNGIYYNKTATGYTDWIVLDRDSGEWESGHFYIPTWAEETQNASIQIMVVAINAVGEDGEDRTDQVDDENESNIDYNDYVLIFDESVQLSGRIYDFQVVGITDKEQFTPAGDSFTDSYSFVKEYSEKKLGGYNRLGGDVVRYTLDKSLCYGWDARNTLPFCNGKGLTSSLGTLWKGTTFSFSVKTMANLWDVGSLTNENGGVVTDQLRIAPSYRYVYKDASGNTVVNENVDIYYHNYSTDTPMLYTKMGSNADLSTRSYVNLSDGSFDGSYTWKDVEYTVNKLNGWTGNNYKADAWVKRDRESYNMASIILNSDLRLLTGYEEEMGNNLEKDSSLIARYADDFAFKDRFDYSIQTWYGSYYIPSTLLVAPKEIDVNKDGSVDANDDVNGDGVVDLTDYALTYGLTDDSDVWLPTDNAYLVLNFDITSINDGLPHLSYYGSTLDMWARETYNGTKEPLIDPSKPDTPANRQPYDTVTVDDGLDNPVDVPIVTGDVAIITLEDSTSDKYDAGIFFIN